MSSGSSARPSAECGSGSSSPEVQQRAGDGRPAHRYEDLLGAGVEVWELPGTVVHAKVVVADDVVSFGTVNLDAWALYRNSEIMMIARSRELAGSCSRSACSSPTSRARGAARRPGDAERLESWLGDKLAYYL